MAATTRAPRVFVSHLSGTAVFDRDGDRVGRIRDVVVTLHASRTAAPRVLGLVIEVQGRRRIFLPMTRVTAIDAGQVIITGLINMRRFQQRGTETLVIGELLDRQVSFVASGESVTVRDIALEPARGREWEIRKLWVERPGKGLRRRGETVTVDWQAVTGLASDTGAQGAVNLLAAFETMRPADLAQALHDLTSKRRSEVAAALDDDRLADVLEEMTEDDQLEILGKLEQERAADVLEAMDPDDAADLLGELPQEEAERLLALMEPAEAAPVRRLLVYSDDTAGGIMTSEPVVLEPDAVVAVALAHIRNADLTPAHASQVYVCRPPTETPTGRYLGTIHFQRLLREPPASLVGAALGEEPEPLRPDEPLTGVANYMATYNMVAAPVVDENGHLLGAVTVDDVLDHLLPEDWRTSQDDEWGDDGQGGESGT